MTVVQVVPEFKLGGAETMCENLTTALAALGHDVVAVSLNDSKSPITERLEDKHIDLRYFHKKTGIDLSMVTKLREIIREMKPDVIHSHINSIQYAFPAAMLENVPVRIHTFHTLAKEENVKSIRIMNRYAFKLGNVVPVALSDATKQSIIDEYGLSEDKIPVINNGIDLNKCDVKTEYCKKDVFTFLHIGRFVDVKNHAGLIKSFEMFHSKHENSRLILIGDGPLRQNAEELITSLKLNDCVELAGEQDNVYKFLHEADVFVLPSLYEGMPMTLIEAMGTGLPIIASCVGGIVDMLENEKTALLVMPNEDEISKAMFRYYEDDKLRAATGKAALKKAENYSSITMGKNYEKLYSARMKEE